MNTIQQWSPSESTDDRGVAEAIERWHVAHDIAIPADAEFQNAAWEVPAGTTENHGLHAYMATPLAETMRVTMPSQSVYLLSISFEDSCGCPECGGRPQYECVEATIADVPAVCATGCSAPVVTLEPEALCGKCARGML